MASITLDYRQGDLHSLGSLRLDIIFCIPIKYIEERKKHLDELERWNAAFSHILEKTSKSDKDYLGRRHLSCYI
jgi:hypothetical protein